jgi:FMN-dependent NADH-azoreductase
MKKLLYINACINKEDSRTDRLARAWIEKKLSTGEYQLQTVVLAEEKNLSPLLWTGLQNRQESIEQKDFSTPYFRFARDFAAANEIVIACPYWDMSFPSVFKVYLEHLCINGLTFCYSPQGIPQGLTGISSAVYFTTSGGYIGKNNCGFDYVQKLFSQLFGIGEIKCFSAEGLDIKGNDPEKILAQTIEQINFSA